MIMKRLPSAKTAHDSTASRTVCSFFHDFIPLYGLKEGNRAVLARSYCTDCIVRVSQARHFRIHLVVRSFKKDQSIRYLFVHFWIILNNKQNKQTKVSEEKMEA